MDEKNKYTHIRLLKETTQRMKNIKFYRRETYDEIIDRLINEHIESKKDVGATQYENE